MHELDLQLDYWNQVGPTKPFAHPINVERLKRWLQPSSRILDYGCGYGRALDLLNSNGYTNLVGIDPASAMIASARQKLPEIPFDVIKDFRHVELPDESFDAVLLITVLTCVPGNDAQRAIIAEITRLLKPGGLLYISDMWLQSDARNVERYVRDEKKYGVYGIFDLREGVTVRHQDPRWIEALLSNYRLLALDEIEVQTMNGHPATAFQWFGRLNSSTSNHREL